MEPKLNIVQRFDYGIVDAQGFPLCGRAYVHAAGYKEAYQEDITRAVAHVKEVTASDELIKIRKIKFDYSLAVLWGSNHGDKMIDFFGFRCPVWHSNPEIVSWVTKNGAVISGQLANEISCGDGIIILGAEERYRRTVTNDEFVHQPPKIEGLELEVDMATNLGRMDLLELLKNPKT